jgi:hypothetical protein
MRLDWYNISQYIGFLKVIRRKTRSVDHVVSEIYSHDFSARMTVCGKINYRGYDVRLKII